MNRDMTATGWSWEGTNAPRCNPFASSGRQTCDMGMFGHRTEWRSGKVCSAVIGKQATSGASWKGLNVGLVSDVYIRNWRHTCASLNRKGKTWMRALGCTWSLENDVSIWKSHSPWQWGHGGRTILINKKMEEAIWICGSSLRPCHSGGSAVGHVRLIAKCHSQVWGR